MYEKRTEIVNIPMAKAAAFWNVTKVQVGFADVPIGVLPLQQSKL